MIIVLVVVCGCDVEHDDRESLLMFGELIAWYLFFGGVAGGTCLAMLIIYFCVWRSGAKFARLQAAVDGRNQAKAQLRIALAQLEVAKAQTELAFDARLKKASKRQVATSLKEVRALEDATCNDDETLIASYLIGLRHYQMWQHCRAATERPLLVIATFAALVGSVCLLGDLVRPERAHLLFLQPTFSIINVGAFCLALFLLVLVLLLLRTVFAWRLPRWLVVTLHALAGLLALALIVYTGVYLNSIWTIAPWSSPYLVALFFFSSLACGAAVPLMVMGIKSYHQDAYTVPMRAFTWLDMIFIGGEVLSLVAMMIGLGGTTPDSPFMLFFSDDLALSFIVGFLTCGIAIPLLLDLAMLRMRNHGSWVALVGGCSTLTGGYFLRFCAIGVSVIYKAIVVSALGV